MNLFSVIVIILAKKIILLVKVKILLIKIVSDI